MIRMLKIAIDSGHGLNTAGKEVPGYMGYGKIKEWTLNDKITRALMNLLKDYNVETLRLDDPTGNKDIPVKDRTKKANEWGAGLLISNHHNAGVNGGNGGGLVVIRKAGDKGFTKAMQELLYDCILAETGLKGNRYDPLAEYKNLILLNTAKVPTVLIEHGFMDSPEDMKVIMQDDFAEKSARGIIRFLEKQYKISKKEADKVDDFKRYTRYGEVLKKGAKGPKVKSLQEDLIKLGYGKMLEPWGADGSFGTATEAAVKALQEDNKLAVDGSVGKATQAKIAELIKAREIDYKKLYEEASRKLADIKKIIG